jgi:hypothetical protein
MAQQREATTDRLIGIIASIKLAGRSGQLVVRRGEGMIGEEGTLTFARGQITEARVGRRQGAEALNWLSTWALAHYTFNADQSGVGISEPFVPVPPSSGPLPGIVNTDKMQHLAALSAAAEVPYTLTAWDDGLLTIEEQGLSRAHKRLYLLVNGQRNVLELVTLSGRNVGDVRGLLQTLVELDLVRIEGKTSSDEE